MHDQDLRKRQVQSYKIFRSLLFSEKAFIEANYAQNGKFRKKDEASVYQVC
jgi:hypothetical protein